MLCVRVGAPYGWIPTVTPFPRNDTRRWFVRCTCDNSHRFLSRRSSRHFVPQDDTWGRGVTRCCLLMSVVSFPGYVSTAFHSAQHDTWWVGCKIANLRKNRRCGNCNAHKCALPRATLDFCASTAQRICTISSSTDKNSCRNFVKLSAWWLAFARVFAVATATLTGAHCREPR